MTTHQIAACALLLLACQQERESSAKTADDVLRVSSHGRLEAVTPVAGGMTRNLIELVFPEPLSLRFSSMERSGATVHLHMRDDVSLAPAVLATQLKHPELLEAHADGRDVVLVFKNDASAESVSLGDHLRDNGVFRPGVFTPGKLLLERREAGPGPRSIEVIEMASEDVEWRRLMAGEVDLMPSAMLSALPNLSGVPDLRVVPLSRPATIALYMRVDGGPTADVRLRRAISMAIRRAPLAEVATGDARLAVVTREDVDAARAEFTALGPQPPIRLLVLSATSDLQRAALVIEQQLASANLDVELQSVDEAEAGRRLLARDYELFLLFGDIDERSFDSMLVSDAPGNMWGYESTEFDAAARSGRIAEAILILHRDLPLVPLYRLPEAVVVSRRFCNVHPVLDYDHSWLADVRLCAPGEAD